MIETILADVRDEDFGTGFDLVMMIFGQLDVVQRVLSLRGSEATQAADLPVVVARRQGGSP